MYLKSKEITNKAMPSLIHVADINWCHFKAELIYCCLRGDTLSQTHNSRKIKDFSHQR